MPNAGRKYRDGATGGLGGVSGQGCPPAEFTTCSRADVGDIWVRNVQEKDISSRRILGETGNGGLYSCVHSSILVSVVTASGGPRRMSLVGGDAISESLG